MNTPTNEALLRQILASYAALGEKVDGLNGRVDEVRSDAREARDAAREMSAATRAQDIPAKIAELKGLVDQVSSAQRVDLVNTSSKITTEMREGHKDHEKRIEALEVAYQRMQGATGLLGWLAKNAPWLITAVVAGAAVFGLKGAHP